MPRTSRSQGRPGTRVVPTEWGASHAPVPLKAATGVADVRHPGMVTVFDEGLGHTVVAVRDAYATAVPVRVQAQWETAAAMLDRDAADESLRVTGYLITLPLESGFPSVGDLEVGDLVTVTGCSDPLLVGVELRIVDVVLGSLRFERDVFAVVNTPATSNT